MIYRVIGIMSGSSLDGLDIAFVELEENGGKWSYEIREAECQPYPEDWIKRLKQAIHLNARDYQLLHCDYGHYIGKEVMRFIDTHQLHYKVSLIASHGHTTFHMPERKMTAQIGDGAAIASETQLPVVTDLRAIDVAFGGQGAPIVPVGEKLLLGDYRYFLNLGGIANISMNAEKYIAFDICPANRVLNMLVAEKRLDFDDGGKLARTGSVDPVMLDKLNDLDYYKQSHPKSLANDFGTDVIFPLLKNSGLSTEDLLRTYVEHIAFQIKSSIKNISASVQGPTKLLATGGGAMNTFLVERLKEQLQSLEISIEIPDEKLIQYKEAMVMALMGVLRWRQENNVMSSVTGANRDSVGGALWTGQDA